MPNKETMQVSSDAGTAIRVSRKRKLWVKGSTLREARYLQTLQAKHDELGAGYLELVDRRRAATAGLKFLLIALQICIFAAFALALIPIGDGHGAFQAAIRDLREILIVISAVVGLGIVLISHHHDVLTDIVSAEVTVRSKGDKDLKELLDISRGLTFFPLPPTSQGDLELGVGYRSLVRACAFFAWVTVAFLALGSILLRFKVLEDIYFVPTFSADISYWVIGFAVITDILGMFMLVLNTGPLRARQRKTERTDR